MRRFVRHPSDIPISIKLEEAAGMAVKAKCAEVHTHNLSYGGICCDVAESLAIGQKIKVSIPDLQPAYEGNGVVVWCMPEGELFNLGVEFIDDREAYKSRMIEQICQIEHYRREIKRKDGRVISSEQAAHEWIDKYAAEFADLVGA